jgi:hypothetical protein
LSKESNESSAFDDSINDEKNNQSEKYRGNNVMNVKSLLIDDPELSLQQKQDSITIESSSQELNTEQINLWKGIIS